MPPVKIMGILNITPDSFSDGGRFTALESALAQARRMVDEGADILDIGGESTRPGHAIVDMETELDRVLPVLQALREETKVAISIDTTKSEVAEAACRNGATMINDVWGLVLDPRLADVAAFHGADLVIMHNRGSVEPEIDILADMKDFFTRSIEVARTAGVPDHKIVLDPGFGFGKTPEQNLDCVRRLGELRRLGYPVLLGVSRKSTIGKITGRPVEERLIGTVVLNALAMRDGVDIVRVHDVAAHVDARKIIEALT